MTSLPERTAKKTLVASIVAPHGNGCKQASYTVHVTIYWVYCVLFCSHEKKLQETKQKLSEAEKVGADLSELKAALMDLQQEGDKIKQKEDEIKKKEKVCMFSIMYFYVLSLILHM
jgi:uncharacterized membrane protein (DUF106 family)